MAKVIFVVHRKEGTTIEQMNGAWKGDTHADLVRRLPGLVRFTQNHLVGEVGATVCDGIGELWFEDDAAMGNALGSPQMEAAVESAKRFLDMEKTGLLIVQEVPIR